MAFTVMLQGSPSDPADQIVELTTAPSTDDITHWGQQVLFVVVLTIWSIVVVEAVAMFLARKQLLP
jgi:hypothetical protein